MMAFRPHILDAVRAHAAREAPRECCGLVTLEAGRQRYHPCRNVAPAASEFEISGEDYAAAEDAGQVLGIVHSHVGTPPEPSPADLAACRTSGLPWLIVNHPTGESRTIVPGAYRAPLEGRAYVHGVHDCWALVRDGLRELAALEVPDFERRDRWYLRGDNLVEQHLVEAGFVKVAHDIREARRFDLLVMQLGAPVPNHTALYLGDGIMLHHPECGLSRKAVFGGQWAKCLRFVARHVSEPA